MQRVKNYLRSLSVSSIAASFLTLSAAKADIAASCGNIAGKSLS